MSKFHFSGSSYGRGELRCWFVGGVWQNPASPSRGKSRRRGGGGGGGGGDSPPGEGASAEMSSSHTFHDSLAASMSLRPIVGNSMVETVSRLIELAPPMTKHNETDHLVL